LRIADRFRLTVREGPRVTREGHATLDEALTSLAAHVTDLTGRLRRPQIDIKTRQFAPSQQVAARIEVAERGRVGSRALGGVDVKGDGSAEAYTGRVRREAVTPRGRETPAQSLRRVLGSPPPA
jgi:hypothetical protein